MQEAFWNIKRNHPKYIQLKIESSREYCLECNKPLKKRYSIRCNMCSKKLWTRGLESDIVSFGTVGKSVVNYQQYLHRSFFNKSNPQPQYRGLKEDRIKAKINPTLLKQSVYKLIRILEARDNPHIDLYRNVRHKKPNISKRLLYDTTLHYIAYYSIKDTPFMSEAHFMATTIRHIHNSIIGSHIRINKSKPHGIGYNNLLVNYGGKYYYRMFEEIDLIMERVMGDILTP